MVHQGSLQDAYVDFGKSTEHEMFRWRNFSLLDSAANGTKRNPICLGVLVEALHVLLALLRGLLVGTVLSCVAEQSLLNIAQIG